MQTAQTIMIHRHPRSFAVRVERRRLAWRAGCVRRIHEAGWPLWRIAQASGVRRWRCEIIIAMHNPRALWGGYEAILNDFFRDSLVAFAADIEQRGVAHA